ncbi:GHKL domain-containing protein [Marivirga sp. S37H4]|uniref:histidine kinase n=1 Tax=Marivirga aurantiaca TaxID=2802615 RepID=A0A935CC66_9BACT|nr:two-component regulator propeller domain-containing protein [Marivirga aurantiaca]MBK6267267.1 GHKL domain-containing protein [Marivirga aurantiaca]
MRNPLLAIVLFCFISFEAQSQYENIEFTHYSVNEGLSQNTVEDIIQDESGFIWFATQDGLNRFDGINFKKYYFKINDKNSLSNNYVKSLYEDKLGNLWIGTYGGGLNKFDKKDSFKRYTYDKNNLGSISDNVVYSILQSSDSILWLGTKNGLNRFNMVTDHFERFTVSSQNSTSISNDVVYCIEKSNHQDEIWVGTRDGLNRFNLKTKKNTRYKDDKNGLTDDDIRTLYLDEAGDLWVGTKLGGLFLKKKGSEQFKQISLDPGRSGKSYIRKIYPDDNGGLWIGTFGNGLFHLDATHKVQYHKRNGPKEELGISDNRIVSIYKDNSNNYWLGTHEGGVNVFNTTSKKFRHYKHEQGNPSSLSHNSINYIYQDSKGEIYIANDLGVDILKEDEKSNEVSFHKIIKSESGLPDDRAWILFEDSENDLWVGLWNYGLSKFNRKTGELTSYINDPKDPQSISTNFVESIAEDKYGNLWLGLIGDGGLNVFDKKTQKFKRYRNETGRVHSLSNDRVHAVFVDSKDRIWIGTDYGLNLYQAGLDNFRHFKYKEDDSLSLNYNIIRIIFEDKDGVLWIGTGGGGISKMIEDKAGDIGFKSYTTDHGLPNNNIAGILQDDFGDIWISTYQGVAKFNPITEQFTNYGKADGLQGQEFIRRSAYKVSDGRLFLGGHNGLNVFHPKKIKVDSFMPNVNLTSVEVLHNGNHVHKDIHSDTLIIHYNDYLISFEVAAMDFTAIEKNQYAYQLEGFDQDWVYNKNRRHFSYTNLPPGNYQLRVKATNSDGVWSDNELKVFVQVVPPFWLTNWFRLLIIVLVAFVIYGYVKWRTYKLSSSKMKLEKLVKERTKEITIANNSLVKNQTIVNSQKDKIIQQNNEISEKNKIIQKQNDDLRLSNLQLEEMVEERTRELKDTNRELFAANHELDTFFYKASHDLKGPVSTIMGLVYLALKESRDSKAMIYFQKIQTTAEHMAKILFNLQKINKLKQKELSIQSHNLREIFEEALKDNIPDNADTEQFIDLSFKGFENNTEIISDNVLLNIIFSNLFSNALKFSKKSKKATVHVSFEKDNRNNQYRILFEDFGIGISEETIESIFDMFFVANENNKGFGLGLYSVRMAVKKLGGTVHVDPSFQNSSCFVIELPIPYYQKSYA